MQRTMGKLKPRRLERRGGRWSLTVEALVAAAPDLFVPARYEVEGPDPIAATLAQMGEGDRLGRQARQIFGQFGPDGADDVAYEPQEGAWLPLAPPPDLLPAPPEAPAPDAEAVGRVEQRLSLLEQRFARVAELERRVQRLQGLEKRLTRVEGALGRGAAPDSAAAGAPGERPARPPEA